MILFGPEGNAAKAKWRKETSEDRRNERRVDVALAAQFLLGDAPHVYDAITTNISVEGVALLAVPPLPHVGSDVTIHITKLGRFRGTVIHVLADGFALRFFESPSCETYLTDALSAMVWQDRGAQEKRKEPRIKIRRRLVHLRIEGKDNIVRIKDLSVSAAAFTTPVRLSIGERGKLGRHPGSITRLFENGAVLTFDERLTPNRFNPEIDL